MTRAVLHVDMDAFYASVEQHDEPSLAGKPLIVGWDGGRGVVAAASYEVRRFGVHSAMPMRTALRLCPQAVCVRPRMQRYQDVSRVVFGVFHEITPLVQGLSLDEAFLDVTASQELLGGAVDIARRIKRRIRELTGLSASVGVAPNKLVAKIASELMKPDGLTVVDAACVREVLDPLSVRRLPGLGRKTGARVEAAGIATLGELRSAPDAVLWPLFGRYCGWMRERASGVDDRPVLPDVEEKSLSAEDTFEHDVPIAETEPIIRSLAEKVWAASRKETRVARTVVLKLKTSEFKILTRSHTPSFPPSTCEQLTEIALDLRQKVDLGPRQRFRLVGVGLGNFEEPADTEVQPTLFK